MSEIVTFDFEGQSVRTMMEGAEPWFVGKDVCGALGIKNHNHALNRRLDDDERKGVAISGPLGKNTQTITVVNEPGVYQLIFASRTDQAKRFKRWLAHEVLPSIRRTGGYMGKATEPENDRAEQALEARYVAALEQLTETQRENHRMVLEKQKEHTKQVIAELLIQNTTMTDQDIGTIIREEDFTVAYIRECVKRYR